MTSIDLSSEVELLSPLLDEEEEVSDLLPMVHRPLKRYSSIDSSSDYADEEVPTAGRVQRISEAGLGTKADLSDDDGGDRSGEEYELFAVNNPITEATAGGIKEHTRKLLPYRHSLNGLDHPTNSSLEIPVQKTPGLIAVTLSGVAVAAAMAYWLNGFTDGLFVLATDTSYSDEHNEGGVEHRNGTINKDANEAISRDTLFLWHPVLMVIGVILLYNGGLVFKLEASKLARTQGRSSSKYTSARVISFVTRSAAWLLLGFGLLAINLHLHRFEGSSAGHGGDSRLYSLHSWLGVAAVTAMGLTSLPGLIRCCIGLAMKGPSILSSPKPASLDVKSLLVVALAMVTALCGILETVICRLHGHHGEPERYSKFAAEGIVLNLLGCSIAAFSCSVIYVIIRIDGDAK